MATIDTAQGFVHGAMGALSDIRQRKLQDEENALRKSELAYTQGRRAITDARADTAWQQQQSDLALAREREHQQYTEAAQKEGIGHVLDALDAGADPNQVMQMYNSTGQHKLTSLTYDPKTKQVGMVGDGGAQLPNGLTTDQIRAAIGITRPAVKLTSLAKGAVAIDEKGNVRASNVQPDEAKFTQEDPTKDTYRYNADGTRTLIRKGVPKAEDAGGRKVSPYNPESHQAQAMKAAHDLYKKKQDELGYIVFENPEDSERQGIGDDFITSWMSQKGVEASQYGAGEIGNLAFKASKAALTQKEAGDKATEAGYPEGSPGYNREVARLLRDSNTKAAQVWKEGIAAIEAKREAKEKRENGGKPPLSSFQR